MSYSAIESARFHKQVYRYDLADLDSNDVRAIREDAPDIAMVRVPSELLRRVNENLNFGVAPILADTLVEYECPLAGKKPAPIKNEAFEFRPISEVPFAEREALVESIFADYTNHYMSNPLLDPADVLAGYLEWGMSFTMGWVLFDQTTPVAFANCAIKRGMFDGTLFGVAHDYAGRGIYGDLVSFTQAKAIEQGFERMTISTQTQNLAVQRAWVRRGFSIARSINTFHVNCLLSDDYVLDSVTGRVDAERPGNFVASVTSLALQLSAVKSVHHVEASWFSDSALAGDGMLVANLKHLDDARRGLVTVKLVSPAGELVACAQLATTG